MQTWGRYTVFSCLERTHLTEVYDAYLPISTDLVRRVHIRKPSALVEAPRALVQHARQAVQLAHSRISPILELSYSGDVPLLVSEGLPGRTLATLMTQSRGREVGLDMHAALAIGIQILEALGHTHQLADPTGTLVGLVHRNVHPESVWIGFDGAVRLGGFGFAVDPTMPRDPMPPLAYPLYWSPELASGEAVDHRADIFSVGAILLEMLTGQTVWPGRTAEEQWTAARRGKVDLLSHTAPKLAPELQRSVDGALAADPDERPPSAAVFRDELARILYRSEPAYSEGRLASAVAVVLGEAAEDDQARAAAAFRHLSHLEPGLVIRPAVDEPGSAPTAGGSVSSVESSPAEAEPGAATEASTAATPDPRPAAKSDRRVKPPAGASSMPPEPAEHAATGAETTPPTVSSMPTADPASAPPTKPPPRPSTPSMKPVPRPSTPLPTVSHESADSFDTLEHRSAEPDAPEPGNSGLDATELASMAFSAELDAPSATGDRPTEAVPAVSPGAAAPPPARAPFTPPVIEAPDPAAAMADAFSAELSSDIQPAVSRSEGTAPSGGRRGIALVALVIAVLGVGLWLASSEQARRQITKTLRLAIIGRKPGGTLVVESIPPGAHVLLDDEDIGTKTPVTMENLESEVTHKLTLRLAEDIVRTTTLSIAANQRRTLRIVFSEAVASVRIATMPADADVYIDGRAVALSPTSVTLRANRVATIKVEKAGYHPHKWSLRPRSGQALKLSHTFKKTDALREAEAEEKAALRAAGISDEAGSAGGADAGDTP